MWSFTLFDANTVMSLFPLVVTSVLILLSFYVGHRLIPKSWPIWLRALMWLLVLSLAFSVPVSFLLRGSGSPWMLVANYAFGFYSLLLTFTALREVFLVVLRIMPKKSVSDQRRAFLRDVSRVGALGATAAVFGYGAARAAATPTLHRVDVVIEDLPAALDGVTIAQLSDVHVGQLVGEREYIQRIVETVNGAHADIIALTGDFVDGSLARLREHFAPLGQLKSKHGAFFVTGNHEYYSNAAEWVAYYKTLGWDVLDNEHRVLNINGESLVIAGVPDYKASGNCLPAKAMLNAPSNATCVLLAHNPSTILLTKGMGINLQLSGHAHAGQYFPGTWLVHLFNEYSQGLNRRGDDQIYVNSGTGYWGPALRTTDITGEITLITLKSARA